MSKRGSRASSSAAARKYRQAGHDDALRFAKLLGLKKDYRRDPQAKKDVIDPAGDAHSIKSGHGRWQVFLYGRTRFVTDDGFQALNGIGTLLVHCIDAFPPRFEDYEKDKAASKERLQTPMRELKDRLQRKALLRAFLTKSLFNGGEVNYLTICDDGQFFVYWNNDVVQRLSANFSVENSKARTDEEFDDQKVVFKYKGRNVGELEMRNDSEAHYAEVRFNMIKDRCMEVLEDTIQDYDDWSEDIRLFGKARYTFGKW